MRLTDLHLLMSNRYRKGKDMSKKKVELEQMGDSEFVVIRLTNTLQPMVGTILNKLRVNSLISSKQYTVVITPRKNHENKKIKKGLDKVS